MPKQIDKRDIQKVSGDSELDSSASVRAMEIYSGPIPPARELAKYESILPGAADRMLSMAERQSSHRQKLEEKMLDANVKAEQVGQVFGFSVFGLTIIAGFVLIILDKDGAGLTSLIIAIGSIIGLFVYNRSDMRKELEKKNGDQSSPKSVKG